MLPKFLRTRGFTDILDQRIANGQTLVATTPDGERLTIRVRLCWVLESGIRDSNRQRTYSAAQLMGAIKNNDWEGTIREKIERERSKGVTDFLFVQREDNEIVYAALVPVVELLPIWCAQRDQYDGLLKAGQLGRANQNPARNGSSPTFWLQDDRAPEIGAALWDHPGVLDLAKVRHVRGISRADGTLDDTLDDIPGSDYSLIGSDGAPVKFGKRSYVKRDKRVRSVVLRRAGGKCERQECDTNRSYSGFLDVHHIFGAEKSDRVWNCVALCPNCHRDAHAAPDSEQINAGLLDYAICFKPPER